MLKGRLVLGCLAIKKICPMEPRSQRVATNPPNIRLSLGVSKGL